jgi:CRISPR-associated protein (TIGR03984 family)
MRKIMKITAVERDVRVEGDVVAQLRRESGRYAFLLAHCDGGVVWGRVENSSLILAPGGEALLTAATLQEARLFGDAGELHVWRVGDAAFRARELRDDAAATQGERTYAQAFDESQVLWGDHCVRADNGFSLMEDGAQGLRHWAPVTLSDAKKGGRRLRLRVRSYVACGDDSVMRVAVSRLVNIEVVGG